MFLSVSRFPSRSTGRFQGSARFAALPLVFALCLVLGGLLFTGCPQNTSDDSYLIGEDTALPAAFKNTRWASQYGDSYTFTGTTLGYGSYEGTVKYVGYLTDARNSGVIIYEYVAGKEQTYYDYDENFKVTGGPFKGPGKFHATYFTELTAATVKLGGAWADGEPHGCEAATLDAAKEKFASIDAQQKYCAMPGTYIKQ